MPEHNPGQMGGTMRLGKRRTIFKSTSSILSTLLGRICPEVLNCFIANFTDFGYYKEIIEEYPLTLLTETNLQVVVVVVVF